MTELHKKLRWQYRIQSGVFIILLLALVALLGYLALQQRVQWDVSQNGRNSLSDTSIDILQKLPGPVQVTAYATEYQAEVGDIRKVITDFVALYQRIKPDLVLQFIDPVEQPLLAQEANVQVNGEIVITYQHKTEHLAVINEQTFSNALLRLARLEDKLIVELSGHGERKLDGRANFDLGEFGKSLQKSGFVSQPLNLAIEQDIPLNADLLIIASPQVDLLPGEVDKLLDYIDRGGNLLWLVDQESLRGLLPLTEKLRLTLTPGVVVDPHAEQLKAPITFSLGAIYGQHPVTSGFQYITVFPYARQITIDDNAGWNSVSLVEVAQNGWVETGDLNAKIEFDQAVDVPGPISVAAALSRNINDREQRIVIVGSGHFLANTYLGNGNNLDFGINLVNWLAGDEEMMVIQPRATIDGNLVLSQSQLTFIAVGQMMALPALFLTIGISIWWYRRRKMAP
ncbi:GldG family protein [Nitrosomonas sp.]|uniref:GldG family protein n=1 Tax=Nitrosomonas sp. TaxID=42353 RepID=UPI001D7C472B|nr:GldG family protein [Nitrosomonas sp.]MBX3617936.1 GldG family protein [Nitrosomonas sp.]